MLYVNNKDGRSCTAYFKRINLFAYHNRFDEGRVLYKLQFYTLTCTISQLVDIIIVSKTGIHEVGRTRGYKETI